MAFKFENLIVYQKALDLSDYVFELVKNKFPKYEQFNLSKCEEILVMINSLKSSILKPKIKKV